MDIRSDAKGLISRELTNRKNEKYDFTKWVVKKLNVKSGFNVLDIGCGTGKQIFSIAEKLLDNGEINGVDKSQIALSVINKKVDELEYKHINTNCLDIDDVPKNVRHNYYDLIYSVYAFYYSKDMISLLNELKGNLNSSGRIMLFGPGLNSNKELIKLIKDSGNKQIDYYKDFLLKSDVENVFDFVEIERFENVIALKNIGDFISWFETSELYNSEYSDKVIDAVEKQIEKLGHFNLTKETILISLKNNK